MQPREPIYRDLLNQGITDAHLIYFLSHLFMPTYPDEPLKGGDPINESLLHNGLYYHTALCYATAIGDKKIAEALLKIGAHPNVYDERYMNSAALLISLEGNQVAIFSLLLTVCDIDIFVLSSSGSAFELARGNTATISRLLKADEQFSICSDEEINIMATTIGKADKTNFAVCQRIETIRAKEQERERTINQECKISTPLKSIVLSYLFNPKPKSLENFQAMHGQPERFKQVMPS